MKSKRPANDPVRGFSETQVRELNDHLEKRPRVYAGGVALRSILDWVHVSQSELDGSADDRRAQSLARSSHIVKHARALQALLAYARPEWAMAGPPPKREPFPWEQFDNCLAKLADSAQEEARAATPKRIRGRRPEEWRDQLVALISYAYRNEDMTRLRVRQHFNQTIKMIFDFLGVPVLDLKAVLRGARSRGTPPPFTWE